MNPENKTPAQVADDAASVVKALKDSLDPWPAEEGTSIAGGVAKPEKIITQETKVTLPDNFASYIPDDKKKSAIDNVLVNILGDNEDNLNIKRAFNLKYEATTYQEYEKILENIKDMSSGKYDNINISDIYSNIYKNNLDSQRNSIKNGLIDQSHSFFVPDPDNGMYSSEESYLALKKSIGSTTEDLKSSLLAKKKISEDKEVFSDLDKQTEKMLSQIEEFKGINDSVKVPYVNIENITPEEEHREEAPLISEENNQTDIPVPPAPKPFIETKNNDEDGGVSEKDVVGSAEQLGAIETVSDSPVEVKNVSTKTEVALKSSPAIPSWVFENYEKRLSDSTVSDTEKGRLEEERDALKKKLSDSPESLIAEYEKTVSDSPVEVKNVSNVPEGADLVEAPKEEPSFADNSKEDLGRVMVAGDIGFEERNQINNESLIETAAIEDAIESVLETGSPREIEVSVNTFNQYGDALRERIEKSKADFGIPAKQTLKLENELESHEKKERSFSQTGEALEFAKQKLKNESLSEKDKEKLEKKIALLEKLNSKLGEKRQSQDRSLVEKFGDGFKKNVAERWRNLSWKRKIAVSVGLAAAGSAFAVTAPIAATGVFLAGMSLRSLSSYSMYQGIKAKRVKNMAEALQKLESENENVISDEYKDKFIEKAITENTFNKKTALLAGLISFGLPEALKYSGITDMVMERGGELIDNIIGETNTAEAVGAGAAVTNAVESSVVESSLFEHSTTEVQAGDNMYKILEREFHISDHVETKGGQYNAIENILSQMRANPAEYGISSGDLNNLKIGETIDIAKIGAIVETYKVGGEGIYDHANGLPAKIVESIENYMPPNAKEALSSALAQKAQVASEATTNLAGSTTVSTAPTSVDTVIQQPLASEADLSELSGIDSAAPQTDSVMSPQITEGSYIPSETMSSPVGEFIPEQTTSPVGEFIPNQAAYNAPEISPSDSKLITASLNDRIANSTVTSTQFVRAGLNPVSDYLQNAGPNDGVANIIKDLQKSSGLPLKGNVMQYAQAATLNTLNNPTNTNNIV